MGALLRHQGEHAPIAVVQRFHLDRAADLLAREDADEIVCPGDRGAVERQDDVAGDEPGPFGRAARLDRGDHDRALLRQAGRMPAAARERELLGGDTDIGTRRAGARWVSGRSPPRGGVKRRRWRVVTWRGAAGLRTPWLLVSTSPSGATMTPDPVPP